VVDLCLIAITARIQQLTTVWREARRDPVEPADALGGIKPEARPGTLAKLGWLTPQVDGIPDCMYLQPVRRLSAETAGGYRCTNASSSSPRSCSACR
jgi:hypothetical protein